MGHAKAATGLHMRYGRSTSGTAPANRRMPRDNARRNNGSGNAHRNYERYVALARDAASRGDRVEAENWYQHAEHYFRVMRQREA
jgi:hypothetical protein